MTVTEMGDPGFAIIHDVLTIEEVEALGAAACEQPPTRHNRRAGARHLLANPAVDTIAHDPRLLRIAQQFLRHPPHLDDSGVDNGPLRVLPGTHTSGILTDHDIARLSQTRMSIDCLVGAGGIIAMRPLLLHASSKAQSERPRRVLHIEYADSRDIGDALELAIV